MTDGEPPRPTSFDPEELGFLPRRPVPWLGPVLLAGTALRVALHELFGAYLDKRELQNALPAEIHDERPGGPAGEHSEFWFDYAADTGDGFDATYSIAYLLAQPELRLTDDGGQVGDGDPAGGRIGGSGPAKDSGPAGVPADGGQVLPRGRLLVFGGDQVYPTPSGANYSDRFKGPYQAALPMPPGHGPSPRLYAVAGNHDWYDGLTAFLRLFARADHAFVGGWQTRQFRSYFAIRLPHGWWLFALDAQPGAYLDDPQLRYFRAAAEQLDAGDRVILCTPSPGWVEAAEKPSSYDSTDYFIRKIINPTGAQVRLLLSGDLHHYARYSGGPATPVGSQPAAPALVHRELITCGGAGAFLYPTHQLPSTLTVPPRESLVRNASPGQEYQLASRYPSASRSRVYAAGVFGRLLLRNPGFVVLIGLLHLLLMGSMANAVQRATSTVEERLVTIPLVAAIVMTIGGTLLFAMPATGGPRRLRHWVIGGAHGLAQIGLAVFGTWAWLQLPLPHLAWPFPLFTAIAFYLPAVAIVGAQLVGAYLLVASLFGVNVNELFAAQAIIDSKAFLRIRIGPDGALTIHPVAVDRVSRRWRPNPDAAADRPWLEPCAPIRYHLIESPIRIE